MHPGESSHPGGSEYVRQRGVEGDLGQVTGSQSLPFPPPSKIKKKEKENAFAV